MYKMAVESMKTVQRRAMYAAQLLLYVSNQGKTQRVFQVKAEFTDFTAVIKMCCVQPLSLLSVHTANVYLYEV